MGKSGKTQKNFYLGSLSKGHTAFEKTQNLDADAEKTNTPFEAPVTLNKNGLQYWLVEQHPNFWRYIHYYDRGKWFECFDKHDLRVIERYGNC